jgi:uncharacterized damage-inducible protein DinB
LNKHDLNVIYDFSYWARDRILDEAEKLDSVEFLLSVESNYGSLQATLVHLLSAEWVWRTRCQEGVSPSALLDLDDFPSILAIRSFWLDEQEKMLDFINGLDEVELTKVISYRRTGGQKESNTLWHILWHVVNHGTEHRSEAASILTSFGRSPGDLDFIHYLRA